MTLHRFGVRGEELDVSVAATGQIAEFARAGVLAPADVQVSRSLCRLGGDERSGVQLAVALAVRAVREGSVCLDLGQVRSQVTEALLDPALLPATTPAAQSITSESITSDADQRRAQLDALDWPEPTTWLAGLNESALVGDSPHQPLRVWDGRVYLARYAIAEARVVDLLGRRVEAPPPQVDEEVLRSSLVTLFGATPATGEPADLQAVAAETAVRSWTTVLAGGPGTGKTTTVAAMLAAIQAQATAPLRVALTAPTGRAARRLASAVAEQAARWNSPAPALPAIPSATTLHALLGSRGPGRGFSYGSHHRLNHDVIVVDEMSMVALPMMSQLLSAVGPATRLVLVGDPHQLASVEAGQVMADVASLDLHRGPGSTTSSVVTLTRNYRNSGVIDQAAQAIRDQDADLAVDLVTSGDAALRLVEVSDPFAGIDEVPGLLETVVEAGVDMVRAARAGDAGAALAALDSQRLMCAHRTGPYGVARWSALVRDAIHDAVPGFNDLVDFYPGRPVLATHNDPDLGVSNGDSGVVVTEPDGGVAVAFGDQLQQHRVPGWLLPGLTTLWAMTIHKAQGSQYPRVSVVLPPPGSPLLTRELLYTALTRARSQVTLIGSQEAVRLAIATPTRRLSGLASRWAQRAESRSLAARPDSDDPAPF